MSTYWPSEAGPWGRFRPLGASRPPHSRGQGFGHCVRFAHVPKSLGVRDGPHPRKAGALIPNPVEGRGHSPLRGDGPPIGGPLIVGGPRVWGRVFVGPHGGPKHVCAKRTPHGPTLWVGLYVGGPRFAGRMGPHGEQPPLHCEAMGGGRRQYA